MSDFQEKDLYEPVKNMLEENGYEVKGEIKNCDIAAVKNGELIVVELKKAFNLFISFWKGRVFQNMYMLPLHAQMKAEKVHHTEVC